MTKEILAGTALRNIAHRHPRRFHCAAHSSRQLTGRIQSRNMVGAYGLTTLSLAVE